jgi:hypothetical protein
MRRKSRWEPSRAPWVADAWECRRILGNGAAFIILPSVKTSVSKRSSPGCTSYAISSGKTGEAPGGPADVPWDPLWTSGGPQGEVLGRVGSMAPAACQRACPTDATAG